MRRIPHGYDVRMTVRLPAWLQGGSYSAETDRSVVTGLLSASSALGGRGGVRYFSGGEFQVKASTPAGMSVDVTAGMAYVSGAYSSTQGTYTVVNDATFTTTITSAHPAYPRIDLVILEVLDLVYSGSSNLAQVRVVPGTAASVPSVPSVSTTNYIPLAQVFVPANVSGIVAGNITDMRTYTGLLNQPIPVRSATERNAMPLVEGLQVYRLDNGWEVNTYSGSTWYGSQERIYNVATCSTYSAVTTGTKTVVDRVKIPDPGWAYMLHLDLDGEIGNARVNAFVYCESTTGTSFANVVAHGQTLSHSALNGSMNRLQINKTFPAVYTGNRWVTLQYVTDTVDHNGWNNTSYFWSFQLRQIPVTPLSYTAAALTGGVP